MRRAQSSFEYIFMIAAGLLLILFVVRFLRNDPHKTGSQLVSKGVDEVSQALSELQGG